MTQFDDAAARFSALYSAHYSLILATCYRRLGNRAAAEDVAQEVFRIAWQRYPEEDLSLAWLYATARNVIGNEYRRTAKAGAAQRFLELSEIVGDSADEAEVRAALRELRPEDRELMYMAYWEDLGAQEIARLLDIKAGAVWVRLTRARAKLRDLLTAMPDEGGCRGRA